MGESSWRGGGGGDQACHASLLSLARGEGPESVDLVRGTEVTGL